MLRRDKSMEKLKDQYISLSNKEMVKVVGVHNAAWWIGEKFGEVNYAAEQAGKLRAHRYG